MSVAEQFHQLEFSGVASTTSSLQSTKTYLPSLTSVTTPTSKA
jgi:hypothetical protein